MSTLLSQLANQARQKQVICESDDDDDDSQQHVDTNLSMSDPSTSVATVRSLPIDEVAAPFFTSIPKTLYPRRSRVLQCSRLVRVPLSDASICTNMGEPYAYAMVELDEEKLLDVLEANSLQQSVMNDQQSGGNNNNNKKKQSQPQTPAEMREREMQRQQKEAEAAKSAATKRKERLQNATTTDKIDSIRLGQRDLYSNIFPFHLYPMSLPLSLKRDFPPSVWILDKPASYLHTQAGLLFQRINRANAVQFSANNVQGYRQWTPAGTPRPVTTAENVRFNGKALSEWYHSSVVKKVCPRYPVGGLFGPSDNSLVAVLGACESMMPKEGLAVLTTFVTQVASQYWNTVNGRFLEVDPLSPLFNDSLPPFLLLSLMQYDNGALVGEANKAPVREQPNYSKKPAPKKPSSQKRKDDSDDEYSEGDDDSTTDDDESGKRSQGVCGKRKQVRKQKKQDNKRQKKENTVFSYVPLTSADALLDCALSSTHSLFVYQVMLNVVEAVEYGGKPPHQDALKRIGFHGTHFRNEVNFALSRNRLQNLTCSRFSEFPVSDLKERITKGGHLKAEALFEHGNPRSQTKFFPMTGVKLITVKFASNGAEFNKPLVPQFFAHSFFSPLAPIVSVPFAMYEIRFPPYGSDAMARHTATTISHVLHQLLCYLHLGGEALKSIEKSVFKHTKGQMELNLLKYDGLMPSLEVSRSRYCYYLDNHKGNVVRHIPALVAPVHQLHSRCPENFIGHITLPAFRWAVAHGANFLGTTFPGCMNALKFSARGEKDVSDFCVLGQLKGKDVYLSLRHIKSNQEELDKESERSMDPTPTPYVCPSAADKADLCSWINELENVRKSCEEQDFAQEDADQDMCATLSLEYIAREMKPHMHLTYKALTVLLDKEEDILHSIFAFFKPVYLIAATEHSVEHDMWTDLTKAAKDDFFAKHQQYLKYLRPDEIDAEEGVTEDQNSKKKKKKKSSDLTEEERFRKQLVRFDVAMSKVTNYHFYQFGTECFKSLIGGLLSKERWLLYVKNWTKALLRISDIQQVEPTLDVAAYLQGVARTIYDQSANAALGPFELFQTFKHKISGGNGASVDVSLQVLVTFLYSEFFKFSGLTETERLIEYLYPLVSVLEHDGRPWTEHLVARNRLDEWVIATNALQAASVSEPVLTQIQKLMYACKENSTLSNEEMVALNAWYSAISRNEVMKQNHQALLGQVANACSGAYGQHLHHQQQQQLGGQGTQRMMLLHNPVRTLMPGSLALATAIVSSSSSGGAPPPSPPRPPLISRNSTLTTAHGKFHIPNPVAHRTMFASSARR